MSQPEYLMNVALKWFAAHPIVTALIGLVLMGAILFGLDSYRARKYQKERAEYDALSKANAEKVAKLEGENAVMRNQIAELEPKALAYHAIVDSQIKVDEGLKDKIERVTEAAANAESNANNSVPCRERADRLCTVFRSSDKHFNCNILYAECR